MLDERDSLLWSRGGACCSTSARVRPSLGGMVAQNRFASPRKLIPIKWVLLHGALPCSLQFLTLC